MNKKKIINYSLLGIAFILFVVVQYYIFKIDVFPKKYYLLFTIIEIVLFSVGIILSFLKKKMFYILSIILSILLIIINSFGIYYIKHLDKFIDKGFSGDVVNLTTFYLVSSSNNNVTINDITLDNKIYYYAHSVNIDKAKDKLGDYLFEEVDSINSFMSTNMETMNYFLIDKLNYNIYMETNSSLQESYKVIYDFDVETTEKRNLDVKDSYNIFVMGKDFGGHDDLNMLITVNTKTHQVLLTSMPRDLYMDVPGYGFKHTVGYMISLGEDAVIKSVENFYQTTIDYKVTIVTENIVEVVDKLGGIEFCSPQNFRTTHAKVIGTYDDTKGQKMYVKKGCKNYNGIEILTIARERIAFNPKGDHQRQENCRQIMINIFKKLASLTTLTNYVDILNSFNGLYITNMNRNAMTILVRSVLENNYEILQQHVGGELYKKALGYEKYIGPAIIADQNDHNNAINKIKEILNN